VLGLALSVWPWVGDPTGSCVQDGQQRNVSAGFFGARDASPDWMPVWAGTIIRIIEFLGQGMGHNKARLAIRNAARKTGPEARR